MKELRIATRQSPLAMWQAEFVQAQLQAHYPELNIVLVPMVSKGDKILDVTLNKIGGKGLFTKELEQAMLNGQADIAVHSMKDVPMHFPAGLKLSVICQREEPTDAFVSNRFDHFDQLPQGAVVGTSSLRRQSQLLAKRPDLIIKFLRGNVGTRLSKLDAGEYDAIILASAGLIRLGLQQRIAHTLDVALSLPAAGQGAVGIESRADMPQLDALLSVLNDTQTQFAVVAERALVKQLNGSCQVPIAAFCQLEQNDSTLSLRLTARVAKEDGSNIVEAQDCQTLSNDDSESQFIAESLGHRVAKQLQAQGADAILATYMHD